MDQEKVPKRKLSLARETLRALGRSAMQQAVGGTGYGGGGSFGTCPFPTDPETCATCGITCADTCHTCRGPSCEETCAPTCGSCMTCP